MSIDTSRAPRSRYDTTGRTEGTGGTTLLGDTGRVPGRGDARRRRLRRWWRRNRRRLRRVLRRAAQTVTPTGRFVLVATILAALLGAGLDWIEARFIAIVGAVLIVVALPFLIGSRAYLIRIVLDRGRVVAGGSVQLRVDVENASGRPAFPAVAELPVGEALREVQIPFLGPNARAELPERIAAERRGVIEVGPVTLSRRDPLGLLRREVTWRDRHIVHVHPQTVALPPGTAGLVRDLEGAPRRRLTDSDLSFHAVREYAQGDDRRHIHWRSTAKTGRLMVRQYEETQTARSAILFDANRSEYGSDEEFELGVSVAASLSLQAVREGRERFVASQWSPGRLRSSIDGLEELPSQTASQLLDGWAELEPADEARPMDLLARGLAESRRPLSIVILVTGSAPDPARLRRAAVAFPADVGVLVARCEAFAEPQARRLDACTAFTVGALGDLPQLMLRGGFA